MILWLEDSQEHLRYANEDKRHALDIDEQCLRRTHATWPVIKEWGSCAPKDPMNKSPFDAQIHMMHAKAEQRHQEEFTKREERIKHKQEHAKNLCAENEALVS